MTADTKPPEGFSLKRWSRRKAEAARAKEEPASPVVPSIPSVPAIRSSALAAAGEAPAPATADALPPVESLTIDSDFAAFLRPKVDEALRRQALKQLFRDPRFNVMDGLDVYIDDYSKPDPIAADIVRQMVQGRYIFDPPQTRINAQGSVEDVPPEEIVREPREDSVDTAGRAREPSRQRTMTHRAAAPASQPAREVADQPACSDAQAPKPPDR